MKKLIVVVMAMVIVAMAGVAMAGGTASVAVSANVVGTCKFNSGGTVAFTLDPSIGGLVTGTVTQPEFWCTKGVHPMEFPMMTASTSLEPRIVWSSRHLVSL